jgi:hypothetical protein
VPETKEKTLEELDSVFSVPLTTHAKYGLAQFIYFFKRWVFFQRSAEKPRVPHADEVEHSQRSFVGEKESDPTKRV